MQRRKFLKTANKGLFATVALTGFSKLLTAQTEETVEYSDIYYYTIDNPTDRDISYAIQVYRSAIEDLKNADDEKKTIELSATLYKNRPGTEDLEEIDSSYEYEIMKSELKEGRESTYVVKCKFKGVTSGENVLPKEFGKKAVFEMDYGIMSDSDSLTWLDKGGSAFITFEPSSLYDSDCFVTTACLASRGLPDNCKELQALRALRDKHVVSTEEGKMLIQRYCEIAPELVSKINRYPNHKQLYDYIYDTLILPSMEMIESGELEQAKLYYVDYVLGLKGLLEANKS